MATSIKVDKLSQVLRTKILDKERNKVFITNFNKSSQKMDLKVPPNCGGFGRIRHFKVGDDDSWIRDPLPLSAANRYLGKTYKNEIRAQVFQLGGCNFRCWYCFVDNKLISAKLEHGEFLTSEELVDLYLHEKDPADVIDLTGGQPDLAPEWTIWMMKALSQKGLNEKVLLWSDDNLSNDYFWRYLSDDEIDYFSKYRNYARVCCFKGIDAESFSLNTKASPELFANQFNLFQRLHNLRIDLYGYITLTAKSDTNFAYAVPKFFDLLQNIHPNLPLRIVPLKIRLYTPVKDRQKASFDDLLIGQELAIKLWKEEISKRFKVDEYSKDIVDIKIY